MESDCYVIRATTEAAHLTMTTWSAFSSASWGGLQSRRTLLQTSPTAFAPTVICNQRRPQWSSQKAVALSPHGANQPVTMLATKPVSICKFMHVCTYEACERLFQKASVLISLSQCCSVSLLRRTQQYQVALARNPTKSMALRTRLAKTMSYAVMRRCLSACLFC